MENLLSNSQNQRKLERAVRNKQVFEMHYVENASIPEIMQKTGLSRNCVYTILRTFASENPQLAEEMKKSGKDITPADYESLKQELLELKKQLAHEKLRADFYEEMVAFGKEVYGIDFKKAGAK